MHLASVNYKFTQKFDVPLDKAFEWAIDYDPGPADWKRMGLKGTRKIKKLNEDTIILDDTRPTEKGLVTKKRLIRINHAQHRFVNTHIGGPTPHSQFIYEFFDEDDGGSRLEFTGMLLLPTKKRLSKVEVERIAKDERKGDGMIWLNLAKAMEAEVR